MTQKIPQVDTYTGEGVEIGMCECCRSQKRLTRHHVVPYAFSRHFDKEVFPENKIMLCRACHDIVEIELVKFRKFFRGRLNIGVEELRQSDEHIRYKKAKAYAWQVVSNSSNIPAQKIMEMTIYIHTMYPNADTYEDFKRIARDETKINETRSEAYGKIIADRIKTLEWEDWFWNMWEKKNKRVIRKLQRKGVENEKARKRYLKHRAPEAGVDVVVAMLTRDGSMEKSDAKKYYNTCDTENKASLRRAAYAWSKKILKQNGISDEAGKRKTVEYISLALDVTEESAEQIYVEASKRKKKSYRKHAFKHFHNFDGSGDD